MDPLPKVTEASIRQHASSDSYHRSREYYEQGAVLSLVRRDQQLHAEVEGSQYEPYRVQITCDAGGIAQACAVAPMIGVAGANILLRPCWPLCIARQKWRKGEDALRRRRRASGPLCKRCWPGWSASNCRPCCCTSSSVSPNWPTWSRQCAVKARCRNAEMPVGVQAPTEPLSLSDVSHLAS